MEDIASFGELHLVDDVSAADWIVAGVRNFQYDVGSLLPVTYEAYARVLHPALRDCAAGDGTEVTWAEAGGGEWTSRARRDGMGRDHGGLVIRRWQQSAGDLGRPAVDRIVAAAPRRSPRACSGRVHVEAVSVLVRGVGRLRQCAISPR